MEIDSETIPYPPPAIQRETNIIPDDPIAPTDLVVLADSFSPRNIPRDITVGHKRPYWARKTL
jgi:hypothetical protein